MRHCLFSLPDLCQSVQFFWFHYTFWARFKSLLSVFLSPTILLSHLVLHSTKRSFLKRDEPASGIYQYPFFSGFKTVIVAAFNIKVLYAVFDRKGDGIYRGPFPHWSAFILHRCQSQQWVTAGGTEYGRIFKILRSLGKNRCFHSSFETHILSCFHCIRYCTQIACWDTFHFFSFPLWGMFFKETMLDKELLSTIEHVQFFLCGYTMRHFLP